MSHPDETMDIDNPQRKETDMSIELMARNATLADLSDLLRRQHDLKLDANVHTSKLHVEDGVWMIEGLSVTEEYLQTRPTEIADGHMAGKLGIPRDYLRALRYGTVVQDEDEDDSGRRRKSRRTARMRPPRLDIYDALLNGVLRGHVDWPHVNPARAEDRQFLVRTFSDPEGGVGIARAVLSDRFGVIDNFDVLLSCLEAIQSCGVHIDVTRCDLTERRMSVRIAAPEVQALAPILTRGYKSPFSGQTGDENPLVHAGFDIGNSETGGASFTLCPVVTVEICKNGLTRDQDKLRHVHLGGRLSEGIVKWSDETQQKNLELVTSMTRDAVTTFLDVDYIQHVIEETEEVAGVRLREPKRVIEVVSKKMKYSEDQADAILNYFIEGGQRTAAGVFNAVTAYSQSIEDPDVARELEATGVQAMTVAAKAAQGGDD